MKITLEIEEDMANKIAMHPNVGKTLRYALMLMQNHIDDTRPNHDMVVETMEELHRVAPFLVQIIKETKKAITEETKSRTVIQEPNWPVT